MENAETYYRRHLPHYQPEYATFHVVFRLAGSLPSYVIEELRQEQEQLKSQTNEVRNIHIERGQSLRLCKLYFEQFNTLSDNASSGPTWLKVPEVAMIVKEAIDYRDDNVFNIMSYCIMPNHVHMLFEPISCNVSRLAESINKKDGRDSVSTYKITKITESLKKYTALRVNRILQKSGPFWQHESYDQVIRDDDELENTLWYILFNPVKAGLVDDWTKWKWSYCKPELMA
ncbi:MAG: transposase [Bacteroidota bacterium]|jgi:REP element-mobilizing transposase RayT